MAQWRLSRVKNFDFLILFFLFLIASLGLAIIWSIAPEFLASQVVFLSFGFLVFLFFRFTDYRIFKDYYFWFYGLSLILLLSPFVFGQVTRGAVRWIRLGPLHLQPSEMVKPLAVLFLAGFLARHHPVNFRSQSLSFLFLLPLVFLIFKQPDLGSSLAVLVIWAGIIFASRLELKFLVFGFWFLVFGFPLIWRFLADYQKRRILSFLDPYADPLGAGYHLIQSVIAVGSGRILGRGLGWGTQSHLYFLPERHTDFVFASLVEELGFLGGLLLLSFYCLLLFRILRIAQEAEDQFGAFIGVGVFSFLFFQVAVHLGMNLGLLPITGLTLPLVSTGGSSILAVMISLGLAESVARRARQREIRIK